MLNTESGFHALLIGINCYLPNQLPSGLYYKSLWGCVQDVDRVAAFLRRDLSIPSERIRKLTSSTPSEGTEPPEAKSQWPTYENIINAFVELTETANPGDQILIHYSGHGGRALTTDAFKDIKGHDGLDEVIVPMDLGDSEGRYVRDTELHYLLGKMVKKGLYVTLVLDSCHAGGATRGRLLDPEQGGTGVRGVGVIDTFKRRSESLVASSEELRQAWQATAKAITRNADVASGWLLEIQGYVLIAACRANEYANEIVFEGQQKNGALTYWFVDTLKRISPDFTYAMLHSRVLAKVNGQFAAQTPQLQGEGRRVVFGVKERLQPKSVPVIEVRSDGTVSINAGMAHGVEPGGQFGIYPINEEVFINSEDRIAVVEVIEANAVSSLCKVLDQLSPQAIEPGCHAVRLDAGKIKLPGRIKTVTEAGQSDAAIHALQAVETALQSMSEGHTGMATKGETPDYLLSVNNEDEYIICDAGGVEIQNLRPPVKIGNGDAAERIIDRLTHLVKYANVRELDNNDMSSSISQKLIIELVNAPIDFKPGSPVRVQSFTSLGQTVEVFDGEWVFLRILNSYHPHVLNITVLDLQPDWGISQIYPARSASYETIDPGREVLLPLHVTLPEGFESGIDIIKVFASIEATSFRSLELPALNQPEPENVARGLAKNPLEAFLTRFNAPNATRAVTVDVCAAVEWTTHQVEVRVSRKAQRMVTSPSTLGA